MSSDGQQPQLRLPQLPQTQPKVFKAASMSGDVFVVPASALLGLPAGEVRAVPFIPPRLDLLDEMEPEAAFALPEALTFAAEPEPEPIAAPVPVVEEAPPPDPSPEIIAAAEAQAAGILATAEGRAQALLQQARQDAANVLEEAKTQTEGWQGEAYAEGYQQGLEAAQAEVASRLQQAADLLAAAQNAREDLLGEVEPEVIKLVLAIAKKVIRREIALDPGIVVETVKESLRRLGGRAIARVRINPAEVQALNEAWTELTPLAREIELIADDRIAPGGCVVESRNGEIDAQVETQVASVSNQLLSLAES